jgi:WD40 repeat protein
MVWDVVTGNPVHNVEINEVINCICYTPDSKYIISASSGGRIRKWDLLDGSQSLISETFDCVKCLSIAGQLDSGYNKVSPKYSDIA